MSDNEKAWIAACALFLTGFIGSCSYSLFQIARSAEQAVEAMSDIRDAMQREGGQ